MRDFGRISRDLRVALVHDWLTGMRGGEKVLEELCALFPDASLHTLVHVPGSVASAIESRRVYTSFIQHLPFARSHYRYYLPLFPAAARSLRVREPVDLVVSSSHAAAKAVAAPRDVPHVCYCHAPMRYIWDERGDYFKFGASRHARRLALAPLRSWLRDWDRRSSVRVDLFLANSEHVRGRIRACYDRDAIVVYPPVDTAFFTPADVPREEPALVVSALVPYKRVDLAVRAFTAARRRLRVVGIGTERRQLERIAGPTIEFVRPVSDATLRDLYRRSAMLVFPGLEDFGIVPVEAQACGLPVVAFGAGGALESVRDGVTGVLFQEQTETALLSAVAQCETTRFDPAALRANAERFGAERFRREFLAALHSVV